MARPSTIPFETLRRFIAEASQHKTDEWAEKLSVSRRRVQQLAKKLGVECAYDPPGPPPGRVRGNLSRYA